MGNMAMPTEANTMVTSLAHYNSALLKENYSLGWAQLRVFAAAADQPFMTTAQEFEKRNTLTRFVTTARLMELLDDLESRTGI